MAFLEQLPIRAARAPRRIVLAEGDEERVRDAALRLAEAGGLEPVVLIADAAIDMPVDWGGEVRRPADDDQLGQFAEVYRETPQGNQLTLAAARDEVRDPLRFAGMMVRTGAADGAVAGAVRIVSGRWGGRRLKVPGGPDVRPTSERVREAWMSILGPELEGATVLDLFAGSGALGLEALSRGARVATFVENSRKVAELLRANIEALDAGSAADLVIDDAFKFITSLQPRAFDIALADPPYSRGLAARLLQRFREVPFAQILSIEHGTDEPLDLSPPDQDRRYGDTAIAIVPAAHSDEENRR